MLMAQRMGCDKIVHQASLGAFWIRRISRYRSYDVSLHHLNSYLLARVVSRLSPPILSSYVPVYDYAYDRTQLSHQQHAF